MAPYRFSSLLLLSTALVSSMTASALAGPAASLVDLGHFSLGDMSADGSILVGVFNNAATYWSSATGLVSLGAPGISSGANGISSDGSTIVGGYYDTSPVAFAYRNGTLTALPSVPGGNYAVALGVSGNGSLVVGYSNDASNSYPVTWSGTGWSTLTVLDKLVPNGVAYAQKTSGDGSIIVGFGSEPGGAEHALYWLGTTPHDLGVAGVASKAFDISYDGSTIVGFDLSFNGFYQAVAYSGPGFTTVTNLGTLSGGQNSTAYAVNSNGSIIVGSSEIAGGERAFRYANGQMEDLNTLLAVAGVDQGGNWLENAMTISADGRYIGAVNDANESKLVYYYDGIGAITDPAATQDTVNQLANTRQAVAIQNDAYFGILTGDLSGSPDQSSAEAFGLVGSAIGGVRATAVLQEG